jgi:bacterioferritin-associated ferredoxin
MDKATIICRCEDITVADIETAVDQGAENFDDVKRLTRCGMGPCQAKMCRCLASAVIAAKTAKSLAEIAPPRLRAPLRPVRTGAVVPKESGFAAVKSVLAEAEPERG